ncbi:MAG: hypothetical protein ACI83B_000470, partial [Sediminicola sp.]
CPLAFGLPLYDNVLDKRNSFQDGWSLRKRYMFYEYSDC